MHRIFLYKLLVNLKSQDIIEINVDDLYEAHEVFINILDEYNLKRSGVNYIDKLEYFVYENWDDVKSKNTGEFYYFTRYGHKPHTSFDYSNKDKNIYLVFGKESTGIPKSILQQDLDHCMRIPMSDNVRSLNLSNCAAICVYEVLRQQDYNDLLKEEPHKGSNYLEIEEEFR